MKNYNKIFKVLMLVLILVSVALLVWGSVVGFESNGGKPVEVLLYWAYFMVIFAIVLVTIVSAIVSGKNNPKSLLKTFIGIVAICAVVFVVYLVSSGSPAVGLLEQPAAGELKLTDTILNLTYLTGALAILAIVVGEVVASVRNKK